MSPAFLHQTSFQQQPSMDQGGQLVHPDGRPATDQEVAVANHYWRNPGLQCPEQYMYLVQQLSHQSSSHIANRIREGFLQYQTTAPQQAVAQAAAQAAVQQQAAAQAAVQQPTVPPAAAAVAGETQPAAEAATALAQLTVGKQVTQPTDQDMPDVTVSGYDTPDWVKAALKALDDTSNQAEYNVGVTASSEMLIWEDSAIAAMCKAATKAINHLTEDYAKLIQANKLDHEMLSASLVEKESTISLMAQQLKERDDTLAQMHQHIENMRGSEQRLRTQINQMSGQRPVSGGRQDGGNRGRGYRGGGHSWSRAWVRSWFLLGQQHWCKLI